MGYARELAELATAYNTGNPLTHRNKIINGAMVIDQRNAGASITPANFDYLADRFMARLTASSKYSARQMDGRNSGASNYESNSSPVGFANSLKVTSLSSYSVGSTDFLAIEQRIEGNNITDLNWGTADAKPVTLSFWVKSSLTGSFGGNLRNAASDYNYAFNYTISSANTWEYKTINVAGPTSGTWQTGNGIGIIAGFNLGIGSTYTGTANTWASGVIYNPTGATSVVGTNGATFYITGVQLEAGRVATPFEMRSYGTELALCQRYYQKMDGASGYLTGSTNVFRNLWWSFKSEMRTAPTCSVGWSAGTGGSYQRAGTSGVDLYVNAGDTTSSPYVTSATASAEL